jgi:hypothetical protein
MMSEDERQDDKILLLDITMSEDERDNEVLLLDITKIVILLLSSIQK